VVKGGFVSNAEIGRDWKIAGAFEDEIRESATNGFIGEFVGNDYCRRALTCVKSCLGMEDPEAEIARLRKERDTAMAAAAEVAKSTGESLVRLRKVEEAAKLVVTARHLTHIDAIAVLRSALGEKTEGGEVK
jgi:hypothetical protein